MGGRAGASTSWRLNGPALQRAGASTSRRFNGPAPLYFVIIVHEITKYLWVGVNKYI
jgi:hypothetical protein